MLLHYFLTDDVISNKPTANNNRRLREQDTLRTSEL